MMDALKNESLQQIQNIDNINTIIMLNTNNLTTLITPPKSSTSPLSSSLTTIISPSLISSSAGTIPAAATTALTYVVNDNNNYYLTSSLSSSITTTHHLVSTNSFELNTATSLSDDSGIPHTNSSISSGDSSRVGMCKFEYELAESDGDVSQFDSLENCSDGGMSGENFNTLKKGTPLAPIDPPPEFQDSPQTTLQRSQILNNFAQTITNNIIKNALKNYTKLTLNDKKILKEKLNNTANNVIDVTTNINNNNKSLLTKNNKKKHIYASDSFLNINYDNYINNIYDEPNIDNDYVDNNIIITRKKKLKHNCLIHYNKNNNNNNDDLYRDCNTDIRKSCRCFDVLKVYNNNNSKYDIEYNDNVNEKSNDFIKNTITNTQLKIYDKNNTKINICDDDYDLCLNNNNSSCNNINDNNNDTVIGNKKLKINNNCCQRHINNNNNNSSSCSSNNNSNKKQIIKTTVLYSPLHHHPGSNLSTINRPNSRNSLNSRLSSSHNSLSISTSNKPDDSIFITQAMSHDALLGNDIIDFYNVPIDSDIYALPIDVIRPDIFDISSTTQSHNCFGLTTTTLGTCTNVNGATLLNNNNSNSNNINDNNSNNNKIHRDRDKLKYTRNTSSNNNNSSCNNNNNNKKRRKNNNIKLLSSEKCNKIKSTISSAANTIKTTQSIIPTTTSTSSNIIIDKRHSVPDNKMEPLHMTLDEIKKYYHSLYTSSSESMESINKKCATNNRKNFNLNISNNNNNNLIKNDKNTTSITQTSVATITTTTTTTSASIIKITNNIKILPINIKNNNNNNISNNKKLITTKDDCASNLNNININNNNNNTNQRYHNHHHHHHHKKQTFSINLKQKFCNIFGFKKTHHNSNNNNNNHQTEQQQQHNNNQQQSQHQDCTISEYSLNNDDINIIVNNNINNSDNNNKKKNFSTRALPPLPPDGVSKNNTKEDDDESKYYVKRDETINTMDFATNIEKVKEYGWYWGPLSSEAAEKILSNEPDASFLVRDSSDDHHIFSLTFKLNGSVRHVRIEQDQGTFSFGSCAKFKSRSIMDFIEKAVEHSRSGRYLFFLHRRPEHGPMRVQLTNPVSRFKHIQSLQHLCRFVILKTVIRKDLIQTLPLPRRILDYLSYKNCYSEQIESDSSQSQGSCDGGNSL